MGYFSQDLAQELPGDDAPLTHVLRVARAAVVVDGHGADRARFWARWAVHRERRGRPHDRKPVRRREGARRARRLRAPAGERAAAGRGVQPLDAAALDALTEALRGWDGAVVAVTHNGQFAEALEPTSVVRVEAARVSARRASNGALTKKDFSPDAAPTGGVAGAVAAPPPRAPQTATRVSTETRCWRPKEKKPSARNCCARRGTPQDHRQDRARVGGARGGPVATMTRGSWRAAPTDAAAQEVQREKDVKTEKQDLYMAEWERLEGHGAGGGDHSRGGRRVRPRIGGISDSTSTYHQFS